MKVANTQKTVNEQYHVLSFSGAKHRMSSVSTNITSNEEYVKRNKTVQQSAHFSSVFLSYLTKIVLISLLFFSIKR